MGHSFFLILFYDSYESFRLLRNDYVIVFVLRNDNVIVFVLRNHYVAGENNRMSHSDYKVIEFHCVI